MFTVVGLTSVAAKAVDRPVGQNVSGRVTDADGRPVAGAFVHAAAQTATVRTDGSGNFTLSDVPLDSVGVVAAKQGFSFAWQLINEPGRTGPVHLHLRPETPQTAPHPDYPRPDTDRRPGTDGKWLSLNGTWSLGFDPKDVGLGESWQRGGREWKHAVAVPFSYTSLAGIGEQSRATSDVFKSQFADVKGTVWYQKDLTTPADWPMDRGVLLRFGAVEWHSQVFLDGQQVAEHDGGYSPFDVDLGRLAPGSRHSLVVRSVVPDNSDRTPYPQGKQMGWYTDTGGIWQSVWLEPGDPARLTTVHVTPKLDFSGSGVSKAEAVVDLQANDPAATGAVRLTVREQGGQPAAPSQGAELPEIKEPGIGRVIGTADVTLFGGKGSATIAVADPRLWSPEKPWLYQVQADLQSVAGKDTAASWFGLRTITRDWAPGHSPREQSDPLQQYQYLHLNNKPVYLRSTLDQAFNPWGVYSYTGLYQGADLRSGRVGEPQKGSVLFDLALAKQLGFNSTRIHIKINDPQYYHWADVLGLMVWYDQPNFGYNGYSPHAEKLYESVLRDAVQRDYNHPSIIIWDTFNEAWGIGAGNGHVIRADAKPWIERMVQLARQLVGGTRLIVDNSPCCRNAHPSESTDILDFHNYLSTWQEWRVELDRQVSHAYPGSTFNMEDGKKQSGQPLLNSEFGPWSGGSDRDQDVAVPFRYTTELMRAQPKMNGYLFTELTDIEFEWNGWSAYDRTLQIPGFLNSRGAQAGVRAANADDVLVFDAPPVQRVTGGQRLSLPVKASLFSGRSANGARLRWRLSGTGDTGTSLPEQPWASKTASPQSYTTVDLGVVDVTVPSELKSGRLDVELVRGGDVLASGQTTLAARSSVQSPSAATVFLDPATAQPSWAQGSSIFDRDGAKAASGLGDGKFTWTVDAPQGDFSRTQLLLEASAARPKLPRTAYPQTSQRRFPTTVKALVDGVEVKSVVLPDAPADARGALSSEAGYDASRYGYRIVLDLDVERLRDAVKDGKLTVSLEASGGGLTVFGPRTGRFAVMPQLLFSQGTGVAGPEVGVAEPYPGSQLGAGVSTYLVAGDLRLGQKSTVIARVVNDSIVPVHNVRPDLLVPPGWTAMPLQSTVIGELTPGEAADIRYEITPSVSGNSRLSTRAFYDDQAGRQVSMASWTLPVVVPEPIAENYPRS